MPGLDRKGPKGEGMRTGRRMGRCNPRNAGKSAEEIMSERNFTLMEIRGIGQGMGLGYGQGRGSMAGRANRSVRCCHSIHNESKHMDITQ
jgi:hypothetical protein